MRSPKRYEACRRSDPRSEIRWAAFAFRPDGSRSEVIVSNMSLGGLQIEGASFADDDQFRLVIPSRGDVNARVRWAAPTSAGAQIDDELVLHDAIPARDSYVIQRLRSFNYSSGRTFGRRGMTAP
jgi:hypothetical protein